MCIYWKVFLIVHSYIALVHNKISSEVPPGHKVYINLNYESPPLKQNIN
jgi:hypothetical protein